MAKDKYALNSSADFQFRRFPSREKQTAAAASWLAGEIEWTTTGDEEPKRAARNAEKDFYSIYEDDKLSIRVALAGGSTPVGVYKLLAQKPLNWARVEFMPTDERCVPLGHPRSNLGMLRQALGADKRFIPLVEGEIVKGMEHWDSVPPDNQWVAAPDTVLLGAGADGHIASLFDHSPVDTPTNHTNLKILRVRPAGQPEERLTLPLHSLAWARSLLLLICGKEKLRALLNTPCGKPMTQTLMKKMLCLREFSDHGVHFGGDGKSPLSQFLQARREVEWGETTYTYIYYAD